MLNQVFKLRYLALIIIIALSPFKVFADSHFSPQEISAPELKRMLDNQADVTLVHALSRIEFAIQHIPNSINIPTNEMSKTDALPSHKESPIVFYCMGVRCKYSLRSAIKAMEKGYKEVYWFKGGIPEWRKYDYPMTVNEKLSKIKVKKLRTYETMDIIEKQQAFILDVRPFWWHGTKNYIAQSLNLPLLELDKHLDALPKDRPIILTDGFMKQSVSAAKYLIYKGFDVAGVMRGGMSRWEKSGMPVVKKEDIQSLNPETGEFSMGAN